MQITAAVVRERSEPFVIDSLELAEPRPDEVLVRVAAAGMCATDLHGRDGYYNTPYPCVYGHEGFTVKVRKDAPLDVIGPIACSGQTGAGAVFNSMKPRPGDSFAVFGIGAVGLSGLMAAKVVGCDPIIGIDIHQSRLELAREFGATHEIDYSARDDVVAEIRKLTGEGVRFSLET